MKLVAADVLEHEVGVGVEPEKLELDLLLCAQGEAPVSHGVRGAVEPERLALRCRQPGDVAEVGGLIGDLHRVGAGLGPLAAGLDVVGLGLGRGEGELRVLADAPVFVPGVDDEVAIGVVEAAQHGVAESPRAGVVALDVDDVGAPGHELDGEPVEVPGGLDLAGGSSRRRKPIR